LLQAVATLVQAVPGEVERENRLATVQAQMYAQVRVELVHRRTQPFTVTQLVDNRVLDLQGAEVSVVDPRTMPAELHGQGAIGGQVILPVDGVDAVVQVIGVLHREALEDQQHAVAQARPKAQAVGGFHVGLATNRRGVLTHLLQTKATGLFGKQAFQALGAGEIKFETVRHE